MLDLVDEKGMDFYQVAKIIGRTYHAVRFKYKAVKQQIKDNGITPIIAEEVLKGKLFTSEEILLMKGYNPKEFKIVSIIDNEWSLDGEKRLFNLQSKVKIVPSEQALTPSEMIELAKTIEPKHIELSTDEITDNYLCIPLFDMHFNGVSDNYDNLRDKIADVILNSYAEILFITGGDFFDVDNMLNTTVKGTRVEDNDIEKSVINAVGFIYPLIETALQNSPCVRLAYLPGNHASSRDYMFSLMIQQQYPDLECDLAIEDYKYAWLGEHSIFLHHGDKRKKTNQLLDIIVSEFGKQWGESKSRYLITGHLHHESTLSTAGLTHYQVQSPKDTSDYERRYGYTTSERGLMLFEFDDIKRRAIYYL